MNQEKEKPYEHRNFAWLIKRLKKGIIVAIIFGSIFVASEVVINIHQNWTNIALQDAETMRDDGKIDYKELNDIRNQLNYVRYYVKYVCSIVSLIAQICLDIAFIFIIIGFLSITIDDSLDKKMRRTSLILASITLLFLMYFIFISVTDEFWLLYYPNYYY